MVVVFGVLIKMMGSSSAAWGFLGVLTAECKLMGRVWCTGCELEIPYTHKSSQKK